MDKGKARTDFEVWVPNEDGIELSPLIEAIAKFPKNGLYKLPFGWRRGLIVPLVGDEPDFDGKFTRKNCNCAGSPFVHIDIAPCALVVRNWELCETDNNSNDFVQINKWDLIEYEEPSFDAITDWTIQTRLRLAKLKNGEEYQETQVFKQFSGSLGAMNKIENAAKWSKERLDAELEKGYNDMLKGRTRPAAMVLSDVKKKYMV